MNEWPKYQFILNLLTFGVSLLSMGVVWWRTREKAVSNKFTGIHKRLDGLEKRVTETQAKVDTPSSHCPGHANLSGRCDAQREDIAEQGSQLAALQTELKHLPKVTDLEKIYEHMNQVRRELSDIKANVAQVSGAMPGITHLTQIMNEFLLKQGSKNQ